MPPNPAVSVIHSDRNRGKGHAVRTGLARSRGSVVAIQDADLELDPAQLTELVAAVLSGDADVIYGSRFLSPTIAPFMTVAGNKLLTSLTNVLFGSSLTDMETCYKVMRGDIARSLQLSANRFDIEPEITARLLLGGHRIVERPVRFAARSRSAGKKMRWRDGWMALRILFTQRLRGR
jgi:glycosyltransferase involved in cell wall biosynthesis